MADAELRESIQQYSVLGKFKLSESDFNNDGEELLSYVCIVYLNKYVGFYFDNIHNHFIRQLSKVKSNQIWLSYQDKPLQWGLPFLVYIDKINEEVELIVHIKRRPEKIIPMQESLRYELKNRYFWNLKQACMIKFKNKWDKQIFQVLTIEQQNQMFQLYSDPKLKLEFFDKFDKIWDNNVLKKESTLQIPLRIFIEDIMIQRGYQLIQGNETVKDLLESIFQDSLPYNQLNIKVQGLDVDLNMPVSSMIFHLLNPDGFTYIIIK